MDEFDEPLESDLDTGRGNKIAIIAVWIAVVGIVVGVTGIFLANQAQTKVRKLEVKLASAPDKTPELESSISELDERLVKLGSEFVKLGRQDRQIQENTQSAFDSVTRDIRTNREGINNLSEKMSELVEKLENWQPAAPVRVREPQSAAPPTSGEEAVESTGESGVHFVESGDTLSGIAKQYGVTLSALQRANPTVNPRALQIGQRIVIPSP